MILVLKILVNIRLIDVNEGKVYFGFELEDLIMMFDESREYFNFWIKAIFPQIFS
jgi:hypothetical protein